MRHGIDEERKSFDDNELNRRPAQAHAANDFNQPRLLRSEAMYFDSESEQDESVISS